MKFDLTLAEQAAIISVADKIKKDIKPEEPKPVEPTPTDPEDIMQMSWREFFGSEFGDVKKGLGRLFDKRKLIPASGLAIYFDYEDKPDKKVGISFTTLDPNELSTRRLGCLSRTRGDFGHDDGQNRHVWGTGRGISAVNYSDRYNVRLRPGRYYFNVKNLSPKPGLNWLWLRVYYTERNF